MDITVKIEAPALVDAIHALSAALAGNIELLLNLPEIYGQTSKVAIQTTVPQLEPVNEKVKTATETPETVPETVEIVDKEVKPFTLEQVRAKLAALSQDGKQAQVKELINKYAKKLTEIPEEHYAAVMEAAGAL